MRPNIIGTSDEFDAALKAEQEQEERDAGTSDVPDILPNSSMIRIEALLKHTTFFPPTSPEAVMDDFEKRIETYKRAIAVTKPVEALVRDVERELIGS